jgi:hypothetical protein
MQRLLAAIMAILVTSCFNRVSPLQADSSKPSPEWHTVIGSGRCSPYPAKLRAVHAEFRHIEVEAQPVGWQSAREAALAFYAFHDSAYQATVPTTELVGFLLRDAHGRYFFTNAAEVPFAFRLTAGIALPRDWVVGGMLHTHPGGRDCQEEFSIEDRATVLRGAAAASYVRTPLGNVLLLDARLAKSTFVGHGALGQSICTNDLPCLAAHRIVEEKSRYASR